VPSGVAELQYPCTFGAISADSVTSAAILMGGLRVLRIVRATLAARAPRESSPAAASAYAYTNEVPGAGCEQSIAFVGPNAWHQNYMIGRRKSDAFVAEHGRGYSCMVLAALFRLQSSSCETEYNFVYNCMLISMSY
jgi:hypothetical protein